MSYEYNSIQPIYNQIRQELCRRIASGKFKPGEKLPSIRDAAVIFKVSPDTIQRVYTQLEQLSIIETRRGLGTFVTEDENWVKQFARGRLLEKVNSFVHEMKDMGVSVEELEYAFKNSVNQTFSTEPSIPQSIKDGVEKMNIQNKRDAQLFLMNFEKYAKHDADRHPTLAFINHVDHPDEIVRAKIKKVADKWFYHSYGETWMQLTAKEITNIVKFVLIHRNEMIAALNVDEDQFLS